MDHVWRKKWLILACSLLALASVLSVRALHFTPPSASETSRRQPSSLVDERAASILAGALRIATVADRKGPEADAAFTRLHEYMREAFPLLHATLGRERFGGSLLFTWVGSDPMAASVVFTGHLDVVPVEHEGRGWTHPPFAGVVAGGTVFGRGALDDKGSVFALLEAVEDLVRQGFVPRGTIYLAFGHDEETGGTLGASVLARALVNRAVRPSWVLDEGGFVVEGSIPLLAANAALVGVAEKGYASFVLQVRGAGGHSSMPASGGPIAVLAEALLRVESSGMPARIDRATSAMFDRLGRHMPFAARIVFANLWLFEPLVVAALVRTPATHALVRTTFAPTMLSAGTKDNVLPGSATATVNARILPGDTVFEARAYLERVIDDPRVEITVVPGQREPTDIAPVDGAAFASIEAAISAVFPDAVVAPYLVVGGTDARHYASLTTSLFRFAPLRLRESDRERIHGVDEQIDLVDYRKAVEFYMTLMRTR